MPDGSIVYPARGGQWEWPREIVGYKRDPKDPFRFTKVWEPCTHRKEVHTRTECGQLRIVAICTCVGCPLVSKALKTPDCMNCEYRA